MGHADLGDNALNSEPATLRAEICPSLALRLHHEQEMHEIKMLLLMVPGAQGLLDLEEQQAVRRRVADMRVALARCGSDDADVLEESSRKGSHASNSAKLSAASAGTMTGSIC